MRVLTRIPFLLFYGEDQRSEPPPTLPYSHQAPAEGWPPGVNNGGWQGVPAYIAANRCERGQYGFYLSERRAQRDHRASGLQFTPGRKRAPTDRSLERRGERPLFVCPRDVKPCQSGGLGQQLKTPDYDRAISPCRTEVKPTRLMSKRCGNTKTGMSLSEIRRWEGLSALSDMPQMDRAIAGRTMITPPSPIPSGNDRSGLPGVDPHHPRN